MAKKDNWDKAAHQYEETFVKEEARRNREYRENELERRKKAKQKAEEEAEVKEASKILQEWIDSDDYQTALRLLTSAGKEWRNDHSVYLGRQDLGQGSSWTLTLNSRIRTSQKGPSDYASYYLEAQGFQKRGTYHSPTYHGDFVADENDAISTATAEEIIRVASAHLKKKSAEVLPYIIKKLDGIASKAKETNEDD